MVLLFTTIVGGKMSEEYDVVLDVLQKHYDVLWKMNKQNMNSEFMSMGIMDDIRFEQMDMLKEAMSVWKNHKENRNV